MLGSVFFVAAALGIGHELLRRGRAVVLVLVAAAVTLVGAFSALPLLGMELAQVRVLHVGEDTAAMVDLAVAIQEGALFETLLTLALLGLFAGTLLLNVYRKLGIRSREELTAALAEMR